MIQKFYLLLGSFLLMSFSIFSQSFEWGGRFGGISETVVKKMHVDDEGNTYTTGYFTDTADLDITENEFNLTSNGFYDVFIKKTNPDGGLAWAIGLGNTLFDYGTGITTDEEGNVYVTGYFDETTDFDPGEEEFELIAQGGGDIFILKLDSDGNFVWAKTVGGTGYEESNSIGVDELGNVYVMGYLYETVDFDPGEDDFSYSSQGAADVFVLVLNSTGGFEKVYTFGGDDQDLALDMTVKSSSEIFISGFFTGTADLDPRPFDEYLVSAGGDYAGFTMQIDETGAITNIANTEGGNITAYSIAVDADNNMYMVGNFNGTVNFAPESGNSDFTFTSNIAFNGFIMKVLSDGTVAWARQLAADDPTFIFDVEVGSDGKVHSAGYFGGTTDFDPSDTEEFMLTQESESASDAFLVTLDSEGNFISAYQFGGVGFIDTHQLGMDAEDNIYLSAQFDGTVDINPLPNAVEEVTSPDFRDSYLLKFSSEVLSAANYQKGDFRLYPNPAKDQLNITTTTGIDGQNYKIYNTLGQLISQGILTQNRSIPVESLNEGVYTLILADTFSAKFVKY